MRFEHIRLERDGGVATLILARPETRNSLTPAMGEEFAAAVEQIRDDPAVRVVVLTGEGKAFCSGGDLGMLARDAGLRSDGPTIGGSSRDFYNRFLAIEKVEVPTIAAINGHAVGAGFCIALACDLRIAANDAKMGMTFVRLGIHPGMGATYFLPRLAGTATASELFFTGRLIDAREAERLGIVTRAVPRDDFASTVGALAREIASAAPVAVRMVKKAIRRGASHSLDEVLDYEALQQGITFQTADAREGIAAFLEKRPPKFTGS
jgi:enoyl-CoA hydratase/carnithine racemase